jgi:rhamnosyltransferase
MNPITPSTNTVGAVIVTFNPEPLRFKALIESALPQVGHLVIVDNGSKAANLAWLRPYHSLSKKLRLIELGNNIGIAAAQNVGIAAVKEQGAEYALLFDHDSLPDSEMVRNLLVVLEDKTQKGIKVGAVGARYYDPRQNNPPPFIEVRGFRVIRKGCNNKDRVVTVSYVIASGSLISMNTLAAVGGMREDLFIDYVDIEWGLRALRQGYQSFGVCDAQMEHDLGDAPILFFGKSIPYHSPLRHYYLFRNAVWLYRQPYLPVGWKLGDASRLVLKYVFYSLFGKPRFQQIKMMSLGICHGVLGRMGKLD